MRLWIHTFVLAVLLTAGSFLAVGSAEAITCSSACSQIRRACIFEAKNVGKVAFADCDSDRDACRTTCESDPTSARRSARTPTRRVWPDVRPRQIRPSASPTVPPPSLRARPSVPTAAMRDAPAAGPRPRPSARRGRLLCGDARTSCETLCVEPIDKSCVRGCLNDQRTCRASAKGFERACKNSCRHRDRAPGVHARLPQADRRGPDDLLPPGGPLLSAAASASSRPEPTRGRPDERTRTAGLLTTNQRLRRLQPRECA